MKDNRYDENIDFVDWDAVWLKEEEALDSGINSVRPISEVKPKSNPKKKKSRMRLVSGSNKKKTRKKRKALSKQSFFGLSRLRAFILF